MVLQKLMKAQGGKIPKPSTAVKKQFLKQPTTSSQPQKKISAKDTSGGEIGQFIGQIEKVGPKFGFIECPDLEDSGHGSKVFVLADELRQYKQGHTVRFTAYLDAQDRLQGKDLKSGLKDQNAPSTRKVANVANSGQKTTITPKDTSGGVVGQFLGTIAQVGPKFGFIECLGVAALMGGMSKVFVLADEFRNYKEGQTVKFTAYLDGKGRLQGKDLKSGLKGDMTASMLGLGGMMSGMMGGMGATRKPITKKDTSGGELGQFVGSIEKIGPKFGFIESADLAAEGQDSKVFVLADEFRQYKQGQTVKFTAYIDGQGRLQGKDLKSGLK